MKTKEDGCVHQQWRLSFGALFIGWPVDRGDFCGLGVSMFVALKPHKMGGINHSNLEVCQHSPSILSKHQDFHPQEVCLRCLKGRLTRCHLFGGHIHSPTPPKAPAWSPKRPVPASLAVSFLGCERLPRSHSPPIQRVISCGKWWVSSNQSCQLPKDFFGTLSIWRNPKESEVISSSPSTDVAKSAHALQLGRFKPSKTRHVEMESDGKWAPFTPPCRF